MHTRADLHLHSTASDGDFAPRDLVSLARQKGLSAMALTDHDTVAGVHEALQTGEQLEFKVIPGIEISAVHEPGILHILGYFPSYPHRLENELQKVQQGRCERTPKIIQKLQEQGLTITMDDILAIAGNAQIGRPHIAKAILLKGYVKTFNEAFDKWLAKGKPAYVDKEKLSAEQAITLIRKHNGIPVLAHPCSLDMSGNELKSFVQHLASLGLQGIEAHYPEHSRERTRLYRSLAQSLGLLITGGSDFHGSDRGGPQLGDAGIDSPTLQALLDRFS